MSIDYAARARALVGVRFRPQGRAEDALDCVGLVLATFGISADAVRRNYRLRGERREAIEAQLLAHFRRVSPQRLQAGDVMLLQAGEDQLHLAVRTAAGFVHAHAGIGKVVETPGVPDWPLLSAYRKRRSR
jgi:lipoprotein Spr